MYKEVEDFLFNFLSLLLHQVCPSPQLLPGSRFRNTHPEGGRSRVLEQDSDGFQPSLHLF